MAVHVVDIGLQGWGRGVGPDQGGAVGTLLSHQDGMLHTGNVGEELLYLGAVDVLTIRGDEHVFLASSANVPLVKWYRLFHTQYRSMIAGGEEDVLVTKKGCHLKHIVGF